MISVVLADDHHLVREGVRALLERAPDIRVVGEAADGRRAVELAKEIRPHVLVVDIAMPRLSGIQVAQRIQALGLETRVVILSMHHDDILVRQALRSGARGYLLKSSVAEELMLAVRAADRGDIYLSPAVTQSVTADFLELSERLEPPASSHLTARQIEVLQLISEGHTNRAMAQVMGISEKTVQKHRSDLMSRLGVHDVASLIQVAARRRLIFLEG